MASIIFSFDLRPQPKRIIVEDNFDYDTLGWDINDVVAVVTFTGPQAVVYENTDFDSPDIVPASSLLLNKVIPLPIDPESETSNAIQGNYTLKVTWYNSVLDETQEFLDTYQYIFDIPTIENNTVSGPYSGTLTSTDTTDYGNNVFLLTREHRISYPTQAPAPDIVSSDAVVVVTPIYTNKWTIQITSEVEYHNADELIILWDGDGEFFECVYGSCISSMYDALNTMMLGYENDLACNTINEETYQKRLVITNTAWHLLNVAYQSGDVEEADAQSYIIQEQVEWTGSGTCGGDTSELVVPCPPYDGGGDPGDVSTYVFTNGITKVVVGITPTIKLGGALIESTSLTIGEYQFGASGSHDGRTVTQTVDTVNGVVQKASDGTTEGRIYVTAEKVTLELADIATPANNRGYEILSNGGLVEKADYTAGYTARSLVSKSYIDANINWGSQVVVSDATLDGDGTAGNPLMVANPFPGFTSLFVDYGYVEPTHTFAEITNKPTTISGYGITDAYTKTNLQTSGGASVHYDNITNVPTTSGYVPVAGGTFTGVVYFATTADRSVVIRKVGSGGTPSIPQGGINYISFQDGDSDEQGYLGIDASGNLILKTSVSGGSIFADGNITVSGTVDGRDVDADGTAQDDHIADDDIHLTLVESNYWVKVTDDISYTAGKVSVENFDVNTTISFAGGDDYTFPSAMATSPNQVLTDVAADGTLTWTNKSIFYKVILGEGGTSGDIQTRLDDAATVLPVGWSGAPDVVTTDLNLTHNVNKAIANVTIWSDDGTSFTKLIGSAAYSTVVGNSLNTIIKIISLATINQKINLYIQFE